MGVLSNIERERRMGYKPYLQGFGPMKTKEAMYYGGSGLSGRARRNLGIAGVLGNLGYQAYESPVGQAVTGVVKPIAKNVIANRVDKAIRRSNYSESDMQKLSQNSRAILDKLLGEGVRNFGEGGSGVRNFGSSVRGFGGSVQQTDQFTKSPLEK